MRASLLALAISVSWVSPLLGQAPALSPHVRADTTPYVPRHELPNGRQLVVVFVGGSEAMGVPAFVDAVRGMKPLVARQAAEMKVPLSIIGVSLDWEVERSYQQLRSMGAWDELVLGNNWINAGAQHYLWLSVDGKPITPQVIVLERTITTNERRLQFGEERRLAGFDGSGEIIEWVRRGAPLPTDVKR